jgi:hypothetical protein
VDKRTYNLLRRQDWEYLSKQLLVHALRRARRYHWRHGGGCEPVSGQSLGDRELVAGWTVRDVVQHVVYKACRGEREWDPDEWELLPWLRWQVNSVMDALARSRPQMYERSLAESDDDETEMLRDKQERRAALVIGNPEAPESSSAEEALLQEEDRRIAKKWIEYQCDLIYRAVDGEPELEEVVDALMNDHGPKRSDLAAALEVTPEEITNRRKRIRRRLARLRDEE